jgi:hypothetical protein
VRTQSSLTPQPNYLRDDYEEECSGGSSGRA